MSSTNHKFEHGINYFACPKCSKMIPDHRPEKMLECKSPSCNIYFRVCMSNSTFCPVYMKLTSIDKVQDLNRSEKKCFKNVKSCLYATEDEVRNDDCENIDDMVVTFSCSVCHDDKEFYVSDQYCPSSWSDSEDDYIAE